MSNQKLFEYFKHNSTMLTFNLTGSFRGQAVLCMRPTDDTGSQKVSVIQDRASLTEFYTNGDMMSYTQSLRIVNEDDEAETACTHVNSTVWSTHGPLMRTQDARIRFLRFSQRESIMFSVTEAGSRHLMEVQLTANKFAARTHSELMFCRATAADAYGKYVWAVTAGNELLVHNAVDKEDRKYQFSENFEPRSVLIISDDGRSAVVVVEHTKTHAAHLLSFVLSGTELTATGNQVVGLGAMQMQPGSLVQGKGCLLFTLSNIEQQQLVLVANNGGQMHCSAHTVNLQNFPKDERHQRVLFTDIVVQQKNLMVAVIVNRNKYAMWTFDMGGSGGYKSTKLQYFPDSMEDLILDRVVLMRANQYKLEEVPGTTLVSAHVTDMISARMRQQLEVATSVARATVDTSHSMADAAKQVAVMKELNALRDGNEASIQRLTAQHERLLRSATAEHNTKVLELEERVAELKTARDSRPTSKQHAALQQQLDKTRQELQVLQQKMADERKAHEAKLAAQAQELVQLQLRLASVTAERDTLRAEMETVREDHTAVIKSVRREADQRAQKQRDDHVFAIKALKDQLDAYRAENTAVLTRVDDARVKYAALEQKYMTVQREAASEHMLLSAQLAEARTHVIDRNMEQEVRQLTLQNEAIQNRSRLQYESMQREIDSLRRANYTISQSYHMLQTVTKFNFLPDGTSLETAMLMMRNLTVFQQDLATARDETTKLRQKVKELETGVTSVDVSSVSSA